MPKFSSFIERFLWAFALLYGGSLLFAAVWLSAGTPFRLIDDYGDWSAVSVFSPNGFHNWLLHDFISGATGRWRPGATLWNAFAWKMFGTDATLHHLARLAVTAVTAAMTSAFFASAFRNRLARLGRKDRLLVVAIPALFVLFWPNRPDARLGPQEIPMAFWLAVSNLAFLKAVRSIRTSGSLSRMVSFACFGASLLALAISKETSVAVLPVFFAGSIAVAFRYGKSRAFPLVAASLSVAIFSVWNVLCALNAGSGYAHADISVSRSVQNAVRLFTQAFGFEASVPLGSILFLTTAIPFFVAMSGLRRNGKSDDAGWIFFLCAEATALSAQLCIQWMIVLRYWYPLVPILSSLLAVSFLSLVDRFSGRARSARIAFAAVFSFFIVCHGHGFCLQFVVQRTAGEVEAAALEESRIEAAAGREVLIRESAFSEYHEKFILANTGFRRRFGGVEMPLSTLAHRPLELGIGQTYATMARNEITAEPVSVCSCRPEDLAIWPLLRFFRRASAVAQLRKHPLERLDAGAVDSAYVWVFFRGPWPLDQEIAP